MLPVIDYGGIAIVIPKVTAVGNVFTENEKYYFEVYLTGTNEPLLIGFDNAKEAKDSRDDLITMISRYYYVHEFGPDYDADESADEEPREADDAGWEPEKH